MALKKIKRETIIKLSNQLQIPIEFVGNHTYITNNNTRKHYNSSLKAYNYLYGIIRQNRKNNNINGYMSI